MILSIHLHNIFASQGFAPLQPLADLPDKIKTRATESDWLLRQVITGNLHVLIKGVLRCSFIQNINTIIITIFTQLINEIQYIITNICLFLGILFFLFFHMTTSSNISYMKNMYFSCSNLTHWQDRVLFL